MPTSTQHADFELTLEVCHELDLSDTEVDNNASSLQLKMKKNKKKKKKKTKLKGNGNGPTEGEAADNACSEAAPDAGPGPGPSTRTAEAEKTINDHDNACGKHCKDCASFRKIINQNLENRIANADPLAKYALAESMKKHMQFPNASKMTLDEIKADIAKTYASLDPLQQTQFSLMWYATCVATYNLAADGVASKNVFQRGPDNKETAWEFVAQQEGLWVQRNPAHGAHSDTKGKGRAW